MVHICKVCPGRGHPHLIAIPAGSQMRPPGWHHVPDNELELKITVQCRGCMRVLTVTREDAVALDSWPFEHKALFKLRT